VAIVIGAVAECAWTLSYELDGITTRSEFLRAAAESVGALIPADQISWLGVDAPGGTTELYGIGGIEQPEVVQALARVIGEHPMWVSYRDQSMDLSPLRMSDLIAVRVWRSHRVYSEVFRPLGAVYQMSVAVTPVRAGVGTGWGFSRSGRDFTDDEMALAARVQPVLMALNHASASAFGRPHAAPVITSARGAQAVERVGLTVREAHILELLATGLTANAIAHVCRISPRTVRKHLENIYIKLGCHDRLVAVQRAAELKLFG
jgi:DNA-binding CsgD family transcriptional regulator